SSFSGGGQHMDGRKLADCYLSCRSSHRSGLGFSSPLALCKHHLEAAQTDWFLQIVDGATSQGFNCTIDSRVSGDKHHIGIGQLEILPQLHTVTVRQMHVEQDNVGMTSFYQDASLPYVPRLVDIIAFFLSDLCNQMPGLGFVFYYK